MTLALQVEWSKAYARAQRFKEEEGLVLEEMKRVQRYFAWRSAWWTELSKSSGSGSIGQGKGAYALKQASMWTTLSSNFLTTWQSELKGLNIDSELISISSE